jgi:hypothetical protein
VEDDFVVRHIHDFLRLEEDSWERGFWKNERRKGNMKRLLLMLAVVALLSACVTGGVAPPKEDNPCPEGQYWSTTSQACRDYPKSI